jgi:hypothetical protein
MKELTFQMKVCKQSCSYNLSIRLHLTCAFFAVLVQDDKAEWSGLALSDSEMLSQVSFDMTVSAYSGIGPGQTFTANLGDGSFAPKQAVDEGSEGSENEDAVDSEDESQESEDPDDIARHRWGMMQNESDSESFEDESDDELDDGEGSTQGNLEEGCLWNEDPSKPFVEPTPLEYYDPAAMVTGVTVTLHQPYGHIEGAKAVLKKRSGKQSDGDADGEADGENTAVIAKSVVAVAISLAKAAISSGEVKIRSAKENMVEYSLAEGWDVSDDALHRRQGWARRPNREDGMYGATYITDEYREELQHMFDQGAENSSSKRGPAEMREQLELKFPGFYCYPGEIEISKAISAMFDKQKKAGTTSKREKILPAAIEVKIREFMEQYPDEKGKGIEALVRPCFNEQNLPHGYTYNRTHVMAKVNAWRQQAKNKKESEEKRSLIG